MVTHVTDAIYVDYDGNVVKEDDPSVFMQAVGPHSDISDTLAEQLGLKGKATGFDTSGAVPGDIGKSVRSQSEAADVQPNHANPVRIGADPNNPDDVHDPEPIQYSVAGVPEFVADAGIVRPEPSGPRTRAQRAKQQAKGTKK